MVYDLNKIINRIKTIANIDILSLELIAENNYCFIFKGICSEKKLIVKCYKTSDNKLAQLEAEGVNCWHQLASDNKEFIDSRALFIDDSEKLIGIDFVKGVSFADFIYKNSADKSAYPLICKLSENLGKILRDFRVKTVQNEGFDDFHCKYLKYCSNSLANFSIAGYKIFSDMPESANKLCEILNNASDKSSFAHGDFVFRNIHVEHECVGLIDFANCLTNSHTMNDYFNLWFALHNMFIPSNLKLSIWRSFKRGLKKIECSNNVAEFFYEFHRRRWLMLNLCSKNPLRWLRALTGIKVFKANYSIAKERFKI